MSSVSQEDALKEIAARYDVDGDGKLSYRELNAYLIGVLGSEWSVCSRPQKNNALLAAIGQDVREVQDRGMKRKEGSVAFDALAKWTITTANASDVDKKNLTRNLALHGYTVGPQGLARSSALPAISTGTFDAVLRARLHGLTDSRALKTAAMDITNAMLSFKIAPAMDLQQLLEEESRWAYVAKMWAEDAAAEKLVFIDPVTKKLVPAAEELIKELFTRTDADHNGLLNAEELAGWSHNVTGRSFSTDFDAVIKSAGGVSLAQLIEFYLKRSRCAT